MYTKYTLYIFLYIYMYSICTIYNIQHEGGRPEDWESGAQDKDAGNIVVCDCEVKKDLEGEAQFGFDVHARTSDT